MVSKQEEIEKALARELRDLKHRSYDSLQSAQWILGILSSLGVVIKVEGELPEPDRGCRMIDGAILADRINSKKAGYTQTIPLVER